MKCPVCETKITAKTRSVPQNRRYFSMIRAFYMHWPEQHERQFYDVEEFRKWAQMKVGHYKVGGRVDRRQFGAAANEMNVTRFKQACAWLVNSVGAHAEVVVHKGELIVLVPKSIAFDKLSSSEASRLFDDVARFLEEQTGLKTDDVMRETVNAA